MNNRRQRMKRPKTLLFFGVLFIILPLLNYLGLAFRFNLSLFQVKAILREIGKIEIILLLFPVLVGIGLILVKKWGWWLFLFYSITLILNNTITLIKDYHMYNIGALVQTVLAFAAIFYFLKKDISAPYMKMYPRGWRLEKRNPIQIQVRINSIDKVTKDISDAGFYVDWIDCPFEINEEVRVEIETDVDKRYFSAGIVRKDEAGTGFAFRQLSADDRIWIAKKIEFVESKMGIGKNITGKFKV